MAGVMLPVGAKHAAAWLLCVAGDRKTEDLGTFAPGSCAKVTPPLLAMLAAARLAPALKLQPYASAREGI